MSTSLDPTPVFPLIGDAHSVYHDLRLRHCVSSLTHTQRFRERLLTTSHSSGVIASSSAWLPLLFETIVLALTLFRTYRGIRQASTGRVMRILLKEGVLYYRCVLGSLGYCPENDLTGVAHTASSSPSRSF